MFANKIRCHCVPLCATVTNRLLDPELGPFPRERGVAEESGLKKVSQSSELLAKLAETSTRDSMSWENCTWQECTK